MELRELEGFRVLSGVDFDDYKMPHRYEQHMTQDASVCYFMLDGEVYGAMEDPEDGYRSSMRELRKCGTAKLKNSFPPTNVLCVHSSHVHKFWWLLGDETLENREKRWDSGYGSVSDCNTLEIYDLSAKRPLKPVLVVGTNYSDSYYPCYVAHFDPTAMGINDEHK